MKKLSLLIAAIMLGAALVIFLLPGTRITSPFVGDTFRRMIRSQTHAKIGILEKGEEKFLLIDGMRYGAINTRVGKPINSYVVALDLVKYFFDKSGDVLILGLGTGSIAKLFAQDSWRVDVIETDSAIVQVAHTQFGFDPARSNVVRQEGRMFLLTHNSLYDVIVIDVFAHGSMPLDLLSTEAFALTQTRLAPQGVLAINTIAVGWDHLIVKSLTATLKSHFSEVIALPTTEPPNAVGNVILFAANRKLDFPAEWIGHPLEFIDDPYAHWAVVQRNHAWDNRFVPDTKGAPVLRDDANPSGAWAAEIRRAMKSKRVEQMGREIWH